MRKILALILVLVLLCSLAGCGAQEETKPGTTQPTGTTNSGNGTPTYLTEEVLIHQAISSARQMGMGAGSAFLKNSDASKEVISNAKLYAIISSDVPEVGKVSVLSDDQFLTQIISLVSRLSGVDAVALGGMLTFSNRFCSPEPMEQDYAVYLKYNDRCHVVVQFTAEGNSMVAAQVYPLPMEAVSPVLNRFFQNARSLGTKDLMQAFSKVQRLGVAAKVTGQAVSADYYINLAQTAFAKVKPLNKDELASISPSDRVTNATLAYSKALSAGFLSAKVYDVTEYVSNQASQLLSGGLFSAELQPWAAMRMAMALPNSFCSQFGEELTAVNTLLANMLGTNPLGATANKQEKTVLVLLEVSPDLSAVMCIYPNENNTYLYQYACIPIDFSQAQAMAAKLGAIPMA